MENSLRNINTFSTNDIIYCWNSGNCESYEIMEIYFSTNGHTVFTLCPVLWTGNAWHHDVVYADDISSWTIDEMIRLRDSWEYAY